MWDARTSASCNMWKSSQEFWEQSIHCKEETIPGLRKKVKCFEISLRWMWIWNTYSQYLSIVQCWTSTMFSLILAVYLKSTGWFNSARPNWIYTKKHTNSMIQFSGEWSFLFCFAARGTEVSFPVERLDSGGHVGRLNHSRLYTSTFQVVYIIWSLRFFLVELIIVLHFSLHL